MNIDYLPFTELEREQHQQILVAGNLVVESINKTFTASCKGYAKFHLCRKLILNQSLKVKPQELKMVQAVENIKFRVIQAHMAKIRQIAKKKIPFARFYSSTERFSALRSDLVAEVLNAALHAIYTYTNDQENFMHFMTTVAYNWLSEYCARTYPLIALDNISDLLRRHHKVRRALVKLGLPNAFEDVMPVMIRQELLDMNIEPTEEAVAKRMKKRAKKYRILEFTLHKRGDATKIQQMLAPVNDDSAELLEEINDLSLDQLQQACLTAKANGKSLRQVARAFDVKPHVVHHAFKRVKQRLLQTV